MYLSVGDACTKAMQMAGRGDKPSPDDMADAAIMATAITKNWAANYGISLWDSKRVLESVEMGNLVVNDGTYYQCIMAHTSDADSEPGTGDDYALYWKETDVVTATTWITGVSYDVNNGIYTTNPDVFSYQQVRYLSAAGQYSDIIMVSKEDFATFDRRDVGIPTHATVEKTPLATFLQLYPTPYEEGGQLEYTLWNKPMDMMDHQGLLNLPDNWILAFIYTLAVELGFLYNIGTEQIALLAAKAKGEFRKCRGTEKSEVKKCFVKPTY